MSVDFDSDTRLRRGFVLVSGSAPRSPVDLVRRRTRQNRSLRRSALRKKRPVASTASMANVRASAAVALVIDSSRCRSLPFKSFAATILARHFPGCCSKAVISSPLYCIARPRCVFIMGRKGEQRLAAISEKLCGFPVHIGLRPTQVGTSLIAVNLPNQANNRRPSPCPFDYYQNKESRPNCAQQMIY